LILPRLIVVAIASLCIAHPGFVFRRRKSINYEPVAAETAIREDIYLMQKAQADINTGYGPSQEPQKPVYNPPYNPPYNPHYNPPVNSQNHPSYS
jgi:hypothetical protein